MPTTAIAASTPYRSRIATAAAAGSAIPRAATVAFGSGDRPYTVDDIDMADEFARMDATVSAAGPLLTVHAVLPGAVVGARTLREVGVFAADGTLMGRKVITPKQFEAETQLEFELHFQY